MQTTWFAIKNIHIKDIQTKMNNDIKKCAHIINRRLTYEKNICSFPNGRYNYKGIIDKNDN